MKGRAITKGGRDQVRKALYMPTLVGLSFATPFFVSMFFNKQSTVLHFILEDGTGYRLRHKEVKLYTHLDGKIIVMSDNEELSYEVMETRHARYQADSKEINVLMDTLLHANRVSYPQGQQPLSSAPYKMASGWAIDLWIITLSIGHL